MNSSDHAPQNSRLTDRAWIRVLFFLVSFFFINLVMQVGSMYFLSLMAGEPFSEFAVDFQNRVAEADVPIGPMLLIQTAGFAGMLGLVFLFRHYLDHKSVRSLGLRIRGWSKDALLGFGLGVALIGVGFGVLWILDMITITSTHFALGSLLISLLFYLVVSLNEEIMLRGYVLSNLLEDYHPYNALGVSALLFTIMHSLNPNITLIGFLNIFLAGVLFGLYYILRRNLWFPIMIHLSWNFFLGPILGFEVSGINSSSFISHELAGPDILTGGSFGFEGSIILTVLLVASCWWIHYRYSDSVSI